MKIDYDLLNRFKLFGVGFTLGILLLVFIFNKKKTRCTWFPNERVLEIIRKKNIEYSADLNHLISLKTIDSAAIDHLLLNGEIDFSKSKVKNNPCRNYWIDGDVKGEKSVLQVKICDSTATLNLLK